MRILQENLLVFRMSHRCVIAARVRLIIAVIDAVFADSFYSNLQAIAASGAA